MAANLTQVGDTIGAINYNFTEINVTNFLPNAISATNQDSNGWVGIIVMAIMCFSVAIYLIKNRNDFNLFDDFELTFASFLIAIDIAFYLLIWRILESYIIFMDIVVIFFVLAALSLMRKDMEAIET